MGLDVSNQRDRPVNNVIIHLMKSANMYNPVFKLSKPVCCPYLAIVLESADLLTRNKTKF